MTGDPEKFVPPFIVIPMPVDKDGNGPITDGTHDKILWEVWDAANQTAAICDTVDEADARCEWWNHRFPERGSAI